MSEKTCNGCGTEENFDANHPVPYFIHEKSNARHERKEKALVKALVISIILGILFTFLSNMAWLYAWFQYDYVSEQNTYTQDGEGYNVMGSGNEVIYGADTGEETQNTQEEEL